MATFDLKQPKFKASRGVSSEWKSFRKGLNQLLRPTELDNEELSQADNILLTGKGVPTGRWGTIKYFTANATGSIRGFGTYKSTDETVNEIFALTDEGFLAKRDGASSTKITGQSWPSGSIIRTEQLGGKTYIVSKNQNFTEYDGTDLSVFATISPPTGLSATNFSGATGSNRVSWKVVAIGENGGQTTPGDNFVLEELPSELSDTEVHLFWTAPSAATLGGFEIYRGREGDETFLAATDPNVTTYVDRGLPASEIVEPPLTNTTGGVKSEFIIKDKDRLLVVPEDDPSRLLISGRFPNHAKFNWEDGGGGIYIDPDSGDNITGLAVQPIADRIIVYKQRSSYLVELSLVQIGNFSYLDPHYAPVSTAVGCSSQNTIATVENDTFYFGRDGLYVTGYEPNFLNIIRTNEISARIRPYLDLLNEDDFKNATAFYVNNKYILSFPQKKEMIVYDRERGAFLGPWKLPYGISHMLKYIDDTGNERWVLGCTSSNQVYRFDVSTDTDDGTAVVKTLRTKKEDFGDFSRLNILKFFYILFRAIKGSTTVNIIIEDRSGATSTVKSFTITGAEVAGRTGWGMDKWGLSTWGIPSGTSATTVGDELTKWGALFKQSRLVQVEVTSTAENSNFELLEIKIDAALQSAGSLSAGQRV